MRGRAKLALGFLTLLNNPSATTRLAYCIAIYYSPFNLQSLLRNIPA
jgi:hypothetical protein